MARGGHIVRKSMCQRDKRLDIQVNHLQLVGQRALDMTARTTETRIVDQDIYPQPGCFHTIIQLFRCSGVGKVISHHMRCDTFFRLKLVFQFNQAVFAAGHENNVALHFRMYPRKFLADA